MKKCVFKIGLLIGLLISLSGCEEKGNANYEDKDLTNAFIKNNKDKLNKIHHIRTFWQYGVLDKRGDLVTKVYLSLFGAPYFDYGFNDCSYVMFIDSSTVEFSKDDIAHYGKETMYKEAQKCLNTVVKEIEKSQKKEIDNSIESKKQKEIYNEKLNKKFNENEVK